MAKRTKRNNAWKNLTAIQRVHLQRTRARRTAIIKHLKEKLTTLSAQRNVMAAQLKEATGKVADAAKRVAEIETRLLEARRHTLPMGDNAAVNFLPLCVLEATPEYDTSTVDHYSGAFPHKMVTGARFRLTV